MNHLRSLAVVLAAAALALSLGTGAFSAVSVERNLQGSVVSDDEAYVGYDTDGISVNGSETTTLLEVTNRLTQDIDVTDVSVSTPSNVLDVTVAESDYPIGIDPGDPDTVPATFTCNQNGTVTTTVDVTVESTSGLTLVSLDGDTTQREFEVDCES